MKKLSRNKVIALVAVLVVVGGGLLFTQTKLYQGQFKLNLSKVCQIPIQNIFPSRTYPGQYVSGVTSEVPSDVTSEVPSDVTSEVTSLVTSIVGTSKVTSEVPSDVTSDVPSDVTSEVSSDVTSKVLLTDWYIQKCLTKKNFSLIDSKEPIL